MAYESMWFNIVSILAAFNLTKAKGKDGAEITPSGEYIMGFLWYVSDRTFVHFFG